MWLATRVELFMGGDENRQFATYERRLIAEDVLGYLAEHPDAKDTIEGVADWWLMKQRVGTVMAEVGAAMGDLVRQGWVERVQGGDGTTFFRVNSARLEEIQRAVRQARER